MKNVMEVPMPDPKVTLAILQNQYGKMSPNVQQFIREQDPDYYCRFVAFSLFARCLSGRRLKKAFGIETSLIKWTNASRECGEKSDACFAPDLAHLDATIKFFKPAVVIVFGKVAAAGIEAWKREHGDTHQFHLIVAPHPAARHKTVQADLDAAALAWQAAL